MVREVVESLVLKMKTNNPLLIAERLGIIVCSDPLGRCHGYLISQGNHKLICLNYDDPLHVQKFTLAHELGHSVLHPEVNYFAMKRTLFSSDWQERQADMFAIHLLLTAELLIEYSHFTIDNWAQFFGLPREIIELRFV